MNWTGRVWLTIFVVWFAKLSMVQGVVTPFMPQSFFFDWNTPGQPFPIPVTEQCQTIHITWSRSTATGPNPTSPYYLQVYTSAYTVPFVISVGDVLSYDWAVPFTPGTLYQICMFDKFGNTGGCQDMYTVIHSSSTPSCTNITFPSPLSVSAVVDNGPMSQFGWIDQCTDLSLMPSGGIPPYTLTVAPALHPPYNITADEARPINWTVSLDWASPFFVSLVDATGASWSNGPLHAGGGGTIACLAGNVTTGPSNEVKLPVTIGSAVGGLVLGLLLGLLGTYLCMKRRFRKELAASRFIDVHSSAGSPNAPSQYQPLPTVSSLGAVSHSVQQMSSVSTMHHRMGMGPGQGYQVEPFVMPDPQAHVGATSEGRPTSAYESNVPGRMTSFHEATTPPPGPVTQSQVYVLHHDSNVPPVTIYHQQGTQIVELPPRYPPYTPRAQSEMLSEGTTSESRSDGTQGNDAPVLDQPRKPNQPRKPARDPSHMTHK